MASTLGFFVLGFFADVDRVSFHWPLPGYLALILAVPALAGNWSRLWRRALWGLAAVGMLAMLFTALSYGAMARAFPIAGSVYSYAQRGIHPHVGFLAGWVTHAQTMKPGTQMPNLTAFTGEELRALTRYLEELK